MCDLRGVNKRIGLAEESAHLRAISQRDLANAKRRRNRGDEGAEAGGRQGPNLDVKARILSYAREARFSDKAGFGRRGAGQDKEAIISCGPSAADQRTAQLRQLMVERHATEMRAYHYDFDGVGV
jgi:hypothetical protein